MNVPVLDLYKKVPIWQFASVECATEYFYLYDEKKHLIDPNVLRRIERANEVMAVEYNLLQKIRADLIEEFNKFLKNNFLIMPTVTIKPPLLEKCKDSEFYDKANLISLRNTTLANYMNGCSISIPYFENKEPIGIMLNAATNEDDYLLRISSEIEKVLQK
jgi:aspartyl-tRNA(Asn)/glutamyl-tRNA(Gln) amidotransferase subunit A